MGGRTFEPGSLWSEVRRVSEAALRSGALMPVATETVVMEACGIAFPVRVLTGLDRKREIAGRQRRAGANPFLPYEEAMFVAHLSATHLCLLNKFNVLDDHALIVTRDFREQSQWLEVADFDALWRCLAERDALGFYNAGPTAGASQRHRHMQLLPIPVGVRGEDFPIEPLFAREYAQGRVIAEAREESVARGPIVRSSSLEFQHALTQIEPLSSLAPAEAAKRSHAIYRELVEACDCRDPGAYNLIVTRRWMFLVARSTAHWNHIPMNALCYAGMLMVRDGDQLALLEGIGPFGLLAATAQPLHAAAQV